MFMLQIVPSSIVKMPKVESLVPSIPSALSTERANTDTGVLPSIRYIDMSSACVPETTIGVRFWRWLVLRIVAIGTMRFMNARVTTEVTSPISPRASLPLTAWNRRRNRLV